MTLLAAAMWPEVSVAYGKKELHTISKLYHRSFIVTGILTLGCIILLIFAGKPIYLMWTRHAVAFNSVFFYGMLTVLFVSCLWGVSSIIPLATNNHFSFSVMFFVTQLVAVILVYTALFACPHISIIPMVLFITESGLLCYTVKNANQVLNSDFKMWKNGIVQETKFLIRNINKLSHIFDK
jgi:O-antigen/teichoic acid export membrane protein